MFASLRSRVAFVTGGGSGIGAATSLMFASQGVKVAVVDVNHEDAEGISQRIERLGGEAIAIAADIAKPEQVQSAVLKTVEKFHRLDIAVNNAGIGGDQAETSDLAVDSWRRVNSINLDGVFYCMKYEIPEMLKNGGGSIINVSSILGQVGFARASAYVAAKHGVVGLTQAAAIEYGPRKIRVNAVGPGFIRTPILSGLSEEMLKSMAQLHALKRIGEPDEVAALITFLASSEASFITGSYYAVDGGYLAS